MKILGEVDGSDIVAGVSPEYYPSGERLVSRALACVEKHDWPAERR
jgi:hypothetical protein